MNTIHSVTDKALYDALNQKQITLNEIQDLFLERGTIICKKTPRKDLARNYSRMTHDYYEHQKIATLLGGQTRTEKNTCVRIESCLDKKDIIAAAEKLKKEITAQDDYCKIIVDGPRVLINIRYLSTNYGKSDFKQAVNKEALIEIEPLDNGYSIRRPDNENLEDYESILLGHISDIQNEQADDSNLDLKINEISLSHNTSSDVRTLFFDKLIRTLDGYDLMDVTDAYVYHPKPESIEAEDGDTETGVHVSRASLKGEGVLKSDELSDLYDRGFYIWKIKWKVKEKLADPDIFELEAQFGDPLNCTNFSYLVKGVRKYKANGQYFSKPQKLSGRDAERFNNLIESRAYSIIMEIS
ncbi:TPA: hypothetical protein NPQ70_001484 [Klebsiella variicola subsp. variicola]|uniref:hypothetical protein n=1 Tax=Klebsiella pneumoniae TaxID=573 RepID=UPI001F15A445|nr:hypothetical protein [Klebsiella pneumoniae]HCB9329008.1 hypothetical protein [Klebsiella variicola]HCI7036206.1 hypothetical protein [Klebsiella variicola subsp. variicola]HCM7831485.1 hypothetical protein [Klebsiella quasipneumoniae subsp. quasipneumoniae]ELA2687977.1 hypothetical protein [Klebsiella pneumoniae]HCM7842768.1 hypothetical protein [Klebsiella quasipneumoniae subsp. quasipneumoniae]